MRKFPDVPARTMAVVLAALVTTAGACEEEAPDADAGADAGARDSGGVPDVVAESAVETGPDVGSPAACDDGTVRGFATAAEVVQAMAGRWIYCGGSGASYFKDMAIEFTADGAWFQLQPDASGALVRKASPGKAGDFTITASGKHFNLTMGYNNHGSTYGTSVALTADPRRLNLGPDFLMPLE